MIHAKFPMITVIMQTIFEAADFCLKNKLFIILSGNPNLKNSSSQKLVHSYITPHTANFDLTTEK